MRYLIIINKEFPFKTGETFLENEINEIPNAFNKVYMVPINVAMNEVQTREIQRENIKVLRVSRFSYKLRKIKYALIGFIKTINYKKENLTMAQQFDQHVDDTISNEISEQLIKKFKKIEFTKNDEIVVYSYWLHNTANIALQLRDYFNNQQIKSVAISRAHRFDLYEEIRRNGFLPSREYLLSNLDEIKSISNDGEKYLKLKYKKYRTKINVSKLGTYSHGQIRYRDSKSFHILTVSNTIPVKRIDLIIQALSIWDKSDIYWTHIGDGSELNKLKKMAQKKLKNVQFEFLGYKKNEEVYEYYKNNVVDVFINVSSSEGIPVSMMEAISFGVPVIATNVGGNSEIAVNNQTGYLMDKDFSDEDLVNHLIKLNEMTFQEKKVLRESTRRFWEENFRAKQNYSEFYQELLNLLENKNL